MMWPLCSSRFTSSSLMYTGCKCSSFDFDFVSVKLASNPCCICHFWIENTMVPASDPFWMSSLLVALKVSTIFHEFGINYNLWSGRSDGNFSEWNSNYALTKITNSRNIQESWHMFGYVILIPSKMVFISKLSKENRSRNTF